MGSMLDLIGGENSLMAAYKALVDGVDPTPNDKLLAVYMEHFQAVHPAGGMNSKALDKFSLADPSIRTLTTSSTTSL